MSCQLDEDAEDDWRNHAGDAEAGIHDPAGRARIGPSDVQGQRPQHRRKRIACRTFTAGRLCPDMRAWPHHSTRTTLCTFFRMRAARERLAGGEPPQDSFPCRGVTTCALDRLAFVRWLRDNEHIWLVTFMLYDLG